MGELVLPSMLRGPVPGIAHEGMHAGVVICFVMAMLAKSAEDLYVAGGVVAGGVLAERAGWAAGGGGDGAAVCGGGGDGGGVCVDGAFSGGGERGGVCVFDF